MCRQATGAGGAQAAVHTPTGVQQAGHTKHLSGRFLFLFKCWYCCVYLYMAYLLHFGAVLLPESCSLSLSHTHTHTWIPRSLFGYTALRIGKVVGTAAWGGNDRREVRMKSWSTCSLGGGRTVSVLVFTFYGIANRPRLDNPSKREHAANHMQDARDFLWP